MGGSTPVIPQRQAVDQECRLQESRFLPNVRENFLLRVAQGWKGPSYEVMGSSGQEMSDHLPWCHRKIPSQAVLQLPTLWGQKHLKSFSQIHWECSPFNKPSSSRVPGLAQGAGHTGREPDSLSSRSWHRDHRAHTIIFDGPIKWSAVTKTDYNGGGYFRQRGRPLSGENVWAEN